MQKKSLDDTEEYLAKLFCRTRGNSPITGGPLGTLKNTKIILGLWLGLGLFYDFFLQKDPLCYK